MKKILVLLAIAVATVGAYAQGLGQVKLANASASKIINSVTALPVVQNFVVAGFYFSKDLGASPSTFTQLGVAPTPVSTAASSALWGLFNGGTKDITGTSPGDTVLVQVRAWSVGYASYELAKASGLATTFIGESVPMTVKLGGGALPVPGIIENGLASFTVSPVPEPSTIALGLLGLAGLLFIRRRK